MLQHMSGNDDPAALKVLAAVVLPVGSHGRDPLDLSDSLTPLNRMVDAVPSESTTIRAFNTLAKQIAGGNATPQQWRQAQQWLVLWRDNDARLQPLLARSYLTEELVPVSHNLSQTAALGLQALDDLQNHRSEAADTIHKDIAFLKSAQKPQAELILAVAPSVELLVEAAGPR